MHVVDLHCDALMKMFQNRAISFIDSPLLDVNATYLRAVKSKLQYFAIYIPEDIHPSFRFEAALVMVDLFYKNIISIPYMKLVKTPEHYLDLKQGEIGAVLSLEGCDCIQGDLMKLQTLVRLGVSAVGLTWNYANEFADGALEQRNAGLSRKGKYLVNWLKQENILVDLSHLNEAGFWDCCEVGGRLFASHSNCRSICDHPRNLTDQQIQALLKRNSLIGITFVPQFLSVGNEATISDVIKHIDHIFSLGGERNVALGSDFDGIVNHVEGLHSFADYPSFIEELLKHFSQEQVEGIVYKNYCNIIKYPYL
ncbi:MAG: dipeptidase [Bacillus sp. (in: firmicutes)]